jgi:DNA adenine methylase
MRNIKPFLQWAGGKNHLVSQLQTHFPHAIAGYDTYIEPFVGAGAMAIHLLAAGYSFKKVIINDLNPVLMNTYRIIQQQPKELLEHLERLKQAYHQLPSMEDKQAYYLKMRNDYNVGNHSQPMRSALFIFLNKTGFGALYRVNAHNEFNVSFGNVNKPVVFCKENMVLIHSLLQGVEIHTGDFARIRKRISGKTFIYLDPPYYHDSTTSGFCSYTVKGFNYREQIRLADFCKSLSCDWMLSNSDSPFIAGLYKEFQIRKTVSQRLLTKNKEVTELVITNY